MYKRILICTDASALAQRAVDEGIALAAALDASVIVLLVTPPFEAPAGYETSPIAAQVERHERDTARTAARTLGAAAKRAEAAGVRCRTLHVGRYPPAATIVETAQAERCDLVVMGSHGHGALGQLFLGSVTTRVASTCAVPLLIVRGGATRTGRGRAAAPAARPARRTKPRLA